MILYISEYSKFSEILSPPKKQDAFFLKKKKNTVSLWEFAFNYFGLGFFVSFAEVLSHTLAAAIVNYLSIQDSS